MQLFSEVLFCTFVVHFYWYDKTSIHVIVDTKTLNKCKCILASSFMLFIHTRAAGSESPCDHVHAIEVLAAMTPIDVLRYLNMKSFGTTELEGDANPIWACANLLAMDKKAISYFMPNHNVWSGCN